MTEIPEHLLKRSQEAKAKAMGESAPAAAPADAPAASAPATTSTAPAAAAPATPAVPAQPAAPPPPKPDAPFIAAAKLRQKIPFWAMATLSILPVWVFMYARSLTPVTETVAGPLGDGATVFTANCSSCHGSGGEGGIGYPFTAGSVLATFPRIEDQLRFVYGGSAEYAAAGVAIYGNPDREGGVHATGARGQMPGFGADIGGSLTEAQILAVVCHERYTLSGADPTGQYLEEYERWCSPEAPAYAGLEDGSLTFENIHEELEGVAPVGIAPAPATAVEGGPGGGDPATEETDDTSNAASGSDENP